MILDVHTRPNMCNLSGYDPFEDFRHVRKLLYLLHSIALSITLSSATCKSQIAENEWNQVLAYRNSGFRCANFAESP